MKMIKIHTEEEYDLANLSREIGTQKIMLPKNTS